MRFAKKWLTLFVFAAGTAAAQFPNKPVTIVVPYPPSGSNDVFARSLGKRLSDAWKQPVIIENKPGANGSIGAAIVSKSPADGYTLMFLSSSFTTGAAIAVNLPFDPVAGFTPVASAAKGPLVLTVKNDLPVKSIGELVALAKAQPGKLNYGSSGTGSINQFATELFDQAAGIKMTHVPYKGMGPATTDVIAGHIDVLVASAPSIMQHVRSGKVRALGVTSPTKSAVVPELGAIAESGVKGYAVELWWGLLAPPGLPKDVLAAINAEANKALATPEMREILAREGTEPWIQTPEQFAAVIKGDIEGWKKVARQAGIKAE